jgi:hypothetical protein
MVISRRWKFGSLNVRSPWKSPTKTSRPPGGEEVERVGHRRGVAGCVDDEGGQVAVSDVFERREHVGTRINHMFYDAPLLAEFQARFGDVGDDESSAAGLDEGENR